MLNFFGGDVARHLLNELAPPKSGPWLRPCGALKRIGPLMPPISDLDKVAGELPRELYIPVASVQRRLEEVKLFKAPGPIVYRIGS